MPNNWKGAQAKESLLHFSLNGSLKTKVGNTHSCDMKCFFVCNSIIYSTIYYIYKSISGDIQKCKSMSIIDLFRLLPWKKTLYISHNSCSISQEQRKQAGFISYASTCFRPTGKGNSNNWGHPTPKMPLLMP